MAQSAYKNQKKTTFSRVNKPHSGAFGGFASPTSNTTYTPNQFFDVCLPHSSRGVVRLVAYMIRKTLGWCDRQGNPQQEVIRVSYHDLVAHAGISRDMIHLALDEAVKGHFIRCISPGRPKSKDDAGQSASYELCWDSSPEYCKDPKRFRGFFEGEGRRTDIPNQFFDSLIPNETLAVIKVVGSIIRFSIGFQAQRGTRRQLVQLSYSDIQRYAHIRSRATLTDALSASLNRNYVSCLEPGYFDPNAGRLSRAAVYALKWADGFGTSVCRKTEPGNPIHFSNDESENRTGTRSESRTGNGRKNEPADRSEIQSGIEMKQKNETFKQQAGLDAAEITESEDTLLKQGFGLKTANILAQRYPKARIDLQIGWLGLRNPARNALGMLRRAIEEDWPNPNASTSILESPGAIFAAHFYAGLAWNDETPVSEPSARDSAAGERYLRRLSASGSAQLNAAELGRAFGRMIAYHSPTLANGGISLSLALQLRGDAFYLRHKARLQDERIKAERSARVAHEALHRPEWTAYLKIQEKRVKEESPREYARFESNRALERQRILDCPWAAFSGERLARFDGDERRFLDFQKFFSTQVLSFWEWDARINPHPYSNAPRPEPTSNSTTT